MYFSSPLLTIKPQVCVATKRIYIHESIYEPMLKAMSAFAATLKVGAPTEEGVMLGPIQNEMQYERVKGFFEDAKKNNYKFAVGKPEVDGGKGFFIHPAIIDNPPHDSRHVVEEPFGMFHPCHPQRFRSPVSPLANGWL